MVVYPSMQNYETLYRFECGIDDLMLRMDKTMAELRAHAAFVLRQELRFPSVRRPLPRPQMPIGFNPLAPLARSNC